MVTMQTNHKPTISTRLKSTDLATIDMIAEALGQSRSEWLYQLIRQELGQADVTTVAALAVRMTLVEKRLGILGKALTG